MSATSRREVGTDASPAEPGICVLEVLVASFVALVVLGGALEVAHAHARIESRHAILLGLAESVRCTLDVMERDLRGAGSDPSARAFHVPPPGCAPPPPPDPGAPPPDAAAPLTVAERARIRVKGDRGVTPSSVRTHVDRNGDGDLEDDDEDSGGDGFLNDDDEDVEYEWTGLTPPAGERARILYRTVRRRDPPASCRPPGAPPSPGPSRLPVADNVVDFRIRYYAGEPPTAPCPAAGASPSEPARDACDPPLADPVPDLREVRRVRIVLALEAPRPDPTSPGPARDRVVATSTITLRNRLF